MAQKRILIIDDDVDFVDLNKAVLVNNGFEVETAFSAREGMDKGFSFAKAIKADPRYKTIPILMISAVAGETGYDFTQDQDGYWMKTDDFVAKPVEPEELVKRINALIDRTK